MEIITGGVTAAKGFKAAAAAAEIKYKGRTDMAMVYSEVPCVAAGTFTTNVVKAAPVKWDQQVVKSGAKAQAVRVTARATIAAVKAAVKAPAPEQKDMAIVRRLLMQLLRYLESLQIACWLHLQA